VAHGRSARPPPDRTRLPTGTSELLGPPKDLGNEIKGGAAASSAKLPPLLIAILNLVEVCILLAISRQRESLEFLGSTTRESERQIVEFVSRFSNPQVRQQVKLYTRKYADLGGVRHQHNWGTRSGAPRLAQVRRFTSSSTIQKLWWLFDVKQPAPKFVGQGLPAASKGNTSSRTYLERGLRRSSQIAARPWAASSLSTFIEHGEGTAAQTAGESFIRVQGQALEGGKGPFKKLSPSNESVFGLHSQRQAHQQGRSERRSWLCQPCPELHGLRLWSVHPPTLCYRNPSSEARKKMRATADIEGPNPRFRCESRKNRQKLKNPASPCSSARKLETNSHKNTSSFPSGRHPPLGAN